MQRRLRPGFWPTAITLAALSILLGLGAWQLLRLEWKTALIAEIQARGAAAPLALPAEISGPALDYTPVRLRGVFLHGKERHVAARTHKGKIGLHIVTPLRLDDGRTVLVNRGWVPLAKQDPAARPAGQLDGDVMVEGLIRKGGWGGSALFRPANQPEENIWLWMDLAAMAGSVSLERAETRVYVAAGPAPNPGGYPIGGQTRLKFANNHLQYAITWFALAAILLAIYILHLCRPPKDKRHDSL